MINKSKSWFPVAGAVGSLAFLLFASFSTSGESRFPPLNGSHNTGETRTYVIQIPDFRVASEDQSWRDSSNKVSRQMSRIAEEILDQICDPTIAVDRRLFALSVVEQFNVRVTAPRLVKAIDFRDDRSRHSSPIGEGKYPIVSFLSDSGKQVVPFVVVALETEVDVNRRSLLCDVMEKTSGIEQAEKSLLSRIESQEIEPTAAKNINLAIQEIRRRHRR